MAVNNNQKHTQHQWQYSSQFFWWVDLYFAEHVACTAAQGVLLFLALHPQMASSIQHHRVTTWNLETLETRVSRLKHLNAPIFHTSWNNLDDINVACLRGFCQEMATTHGFPKKFGTSPAFHVQIAEAATLTPDAPALVPPFGTAQAAAVEVLIARQKTGWCEGTFWA